jgi:hypothetical protein
MTVILVLCTFAIFLTIDHFRSRNAIAEATLHVGAAKSDIAAPRLQHALVGGFAVPENLRFHPGHTWALSESSNLVRIGMDDFASKLTGKLESIALPQRGQWIRQGQKVCTIHRDGVAVDMVSPIEGTVSESAGRPAGPVVDGRVRKPPATPDSSDDGVCRSVGPGRWSCGK